ncbi:MAG: SDR family NAD(P)-dependent oxidoreductase [Myxococcota bacterium]
MTTDDRACIAGLPGQVALVTGATRGIGQATAHELARYGAAVVVVSLHADDAVRVAAELEESFGTRALGLTADVTDYAQVRACIDAARDWGGRIDIVVNNAGYPVDDALWNTPLHEIPGAELEDWFHKVSAVDLSGSRNVTHAVLPAMMEQRSGAIVFVSSTPALAGHKATPYTEAKAGVLGLMRDVALNYGKHNIRANAVAPGNIATAWAEKLSAEERLALASETPLGRWGEPAEVGQAILFLASPLSSFVTGQTLVIDGGKVIR